MATGIVTPLSLDQLALQAAAVKKFTMAVGGMSLGIFISSIRLLVGDISHDDKRLFPGAIVQTVDKAGVSVIAAHSGTAMVTVLFALWSSANARPCQQQGTALIALAINLLGQQSANANTPLQGATGAWSISVAAPALFILGIVVLGGRPVIQTKADLAVTSGMAWWFSFVVVLLCLQVGTISTANFVDLSSDDWQGPNDRSDDDEASIPAVIRFSVAWGAAGLLMMGCCVCAMCCCMGSLGTSGRGAAWSERMIRGLSWAALGLGVGGSTTIGLWVNAFDLCNSQLNELHLDLPNPCDGGQWTWVVMAVLYTYFTYATLRLAAAEWRSCCTGSRRATVGTLAADQPSTQVPSGQRYNQLLNPVLAPNGSTARSAGTGAMYSHDGSDSVSTAPPAYTAATGSVESTPLIDKPGAEPAPPRASAPVAAGSARSQYCHICGTAASAAESEFCSACGTKMAL